MRKTHPFSMTIASQDAQVSVTEEQIAALVGAFYERVRGDATLGPIFELAIGEEWDSHLEQMRAFWSSLILTSGRYKGNPMVSHLSLLPRIGEQHFARWLELWRLTASDVLPPPAAALFVRRAEDIAERLLAAVVLGHNPLVRPVTPG
jgi:hemoglobin